MVIFPSPLQYPNGSLSKCLGFLKVYFHAISQPEFSGNLYVKLHMDMISVDMNSAIDHAQQIRRRSLCDLQ